MFVRKLIHVQVIMHVHIEGLFVCSLEWSVIILDLEPFDKATFGWHGIDPARNVTLFYIENHRQESFHPEFSLNKQTLRPCLDPNFFWILTL
jgi:hypothetical protein